MENRKVVENDDDEDEDEDEEEDEEEEEEEDRFCFCCTLGYGSPLAVLCAILHVIFIENRGAVIIPFTTRTMLHSMTVRITQSDRHNEAIRSETCNVMCDAPGYQNNSLADVTGQVKEGVVEYMRYPVWLNFGTRFHSSNGLIEGNFGNLLPWLLFIMTTWTIVFFTYLMVHVCMEFCCGSSQGKLDVRYGAYFVFTYQMHRRKFYRGMITALMGLSGFFFFAFFVFCALCEGTEFLSQTLGNSLIDFIAWLYGVNSLKAESLVTFDWEVPAFHNLKFKRPFSFLILTNSIYSEKLQAALVHSERVKAGAGEAAYLKYFFPGDPVKVSRSKNLVMGELDKQEGKLNTLQSVDDYHKGQLYWIEDNLEEIGSRTKLM